MTTSTMSTFLLLNRMEMLLRLLYCLGLLKTVLSECQLDLALQGQFQRQISFPVIEARQEEHFPQTAVYEKIILSSSSSSAWGNCYAKLARNAYVFGQVNKSPNNIRPIHPEKEPSSLNICFRCIILIAHTSNVIQSIHQNEDICHESVESAEKNCFLASQITSPVDGTLLFRSEFYNSSSCHLDGVYSISYRLQDLASSTSLECAMHAGSQMSNCDQWNILKFNFRNCSFPDFEQTLVCLGTWPVGRPAARHLPAEHYLAVLNQATQEYKCGLMQAWGNRSARILLSADSSCSSLLKDTNNALEEFFLKQENHLKNSQCNFPTHLLGEYGDGRLFIQSNQIQDKENGGSSPSVVSVCVSPDKKSEGERILVYSTTSCGDPLGFHCLWFRPRSHSVIEFKTTATVSEPSQTMCSNDHEFEQVPWTTLVSNKPKKSLCGFFGQYNTPRELWLSGDCYSLSVEYERLDSFKLVAFHCQTGQAYDVKNYNCLGTWKEDELMFVYTETESVSTGNSIKAEFFCFVSQQHEGNLFVAPIGSHCERDFNFTENSGRTIILNQQQYYQPSTKLDGTLEQKRGPENTQPKQPLSIDVPDYANTANSVNLYFISPIHMTIIAVLLLLWT